jgi:glutaredoxin-related protein
VFLYGLIRVFFNNIKGEFVGGADIVREMYEQGELQELINSAMV